MTVGKFSVTQSLPFRCHHQPFQRQSTSNERILARLVIRCAPLMIARSAGVRPIVFVALDSLRTGDPASDPCVGLGGGVTVRSNVPYISSPTYYGTVSI